VVLGLPRGDRASSGGKDSLPASSRGRPVPSYARRVGIGCVGAGLPRDEAGTDWLNQSTLTPENALRPNGLTLKSCTLALIGWLTVECATGVIGTCCLSRCWACW